MIILIKTIKIKEVEQDRQAAFNISTAPLPARKEQLFRSSIALVSKHFREHRDIAFYARQLCIASHCLSPLIRQTSGDAPSTWIIKAVISEAKVLLKQWQDRPADFRRTGFPQRPFLLPLFQT